jgi:hypothetical protein
MHSHQHNGPILKKLRLQLSGVTRKELTPSFTNKKIRGTKMSKHPMQPSDVQLTAAVLCPKFTAAASVADYLQEKDQFRWRIDKASPLGWNERLRYFHSPIKQPRRGSST